MLCLQAVPGVSFWSTHLLAPARPTGYRLLKAHLLAFDACTFLTLSVCMYDHSSETSPASQMLQTSGRQRIDRHEAF